MPFLRSVRWDLTELDRDVAKTYPFNIPSIRSRQSLDFVAGVTFFTGDNGSGKSTMLEAIGAACGFSIVGGKDLTYELEKDNIRLADYMKLSWLPKVNGGFYFRAETFDTFASYIDELAKDPYIGKTAYKAYGGKSLHERSHGQSFLTFLQNRLGGQGLYLLDEPESALSPQNQLALLRILWEQESAGRAQFIIATHSPILMAYPGAEILRFDEQTVETISYEETEHYQLTRDFLNNRERYFRMLFDEE